VISAHTKLTAAEFLALPESNQHRELIDGEVVMNPPLDLHQEVCNAIVSYLIAFKKQGRLRFAPTGLVLDGANISRT
jgi:hypothetical protein